MRPRPRQHRQRKAVDVTERSIYLRSIPVTAQLRPNVVYAIASQMRERTFESGSLLMTDGEPVEALQLITEGEVVLEKGGQEISRLASPQSTGFLGIIGRTHAGYNAVADGVIRTIELETETLYELMEEHFSLTLMTLRYAAERLLAEMQELPQEALSMGPSDVPLTITDRRLDPVEKILFMRSLSVFKMTNLNALAALSQQMNEQRWKDGDVLWEYGDPSDRTVMLVDGVVECVAEDGRAWQYGSATAVGGVEALAAQNRWYRAVAKGDVVGIWGKTHELLDVMEDNFSLASDFVAMLARGLGAMLARKAAMGQSISQKRNVSRLGAVPVGA